MGLWIAQRKGDGGISSEVSMFIFFGLRLKILVISFLLAHDVCYARCGVDLQLPLPFAQ